MRKIIEHFLHYPIWANAFMILFLLLGASSLGNLRTSFFPELDPGRITISVVYPGTSPKEIEEGLILKIENKIKGIEGIDRYVSTSGENRANIKIFKRDNANTDEIYEDVKSAVDQVPWPVNAEPPVVVKSRFSMPAVVAVLTGPEDLWVLKERAKELEDDMLLNDDITQVAIFGYPSREISIEFSEETLRKYNMTFTEVANAVKASNNDISGGTIKTDSEEFNIRSYGREADVNRVKDIVVRANEDGTVIRVGDVADVIEKWANNNKYGKNNQERAVTVIVNQTENEDLKTVAKAANEVVDKFREKHPDVKTRVVFDSTKTLQERIDLLVENGLLGLILVFITLSFFLNIRIALWVAVGIPVSFAGTFLVGDIVGITINMMSLFAMILVVGILVDDAIVVAEQTFKGIEQGMHPGEAARWGVLKIMAPVFTSVMTTILAFIPFFFFEGRMGAMVWQLGLIVVAALSFSLLESFFILPAHLSHSKGIMHNKPNVVRAKIENFYKTVTNDYYGKALKFVIKYKMAFFMIPFAAFFITKGLFDGGVIKMNQFPSVDSDQIAIDITLPAGTNSSVTDSTLTYVENQILKVADSLENELGYDLITDTRIFIGDNGLEDAGAHAGQLTIYLIGGEIRTMSSMEVTDILRQKVKVPLSVLRYSFGGGGHWGKPISISLTSNNLDKLRKSKDYLKELLATFPELDEIVDLDAVGPREIHIKLKPKARALGFTEEQIMAYVRQGFYGNEIQRIQRGDDEISVWVRYSEKSKASISDLENMFIKTPTGKEIPLSELISYKILREELEIKHYDGKREIKVEADFINQKISAEEIMQRIRVEIMPIFEEQYNDVRWEFTGRGKDNFLASATKYFIPAIIGIVFILILVFRSWTQAGLIFVMIPLGVMGSIWGHGIYGMMISQFSLMGIIALTGIVINDSIVFVDEINSNLRDGLKVEDAVYKAGLSRLRPILMTTITTVAGLLPLMLEKSFQAQMLIPMALSVSFGLIFGCFFIIFLVPVLFLVLNKIRLAIDGAKVWFYKFFFDKEIARKTAEEVEPAVQEVIHANYLMEDINA